MYYKSLITMLAAIAIVPTLHGQDAGAAEAKLRDSLRTTMQQLRTAQAEKAQADADLAALKATSEKEKKDLTARYEALVKQSATEKSTGDAKIEEQTKELALREARLQALANSLAKWQGSHAEVSKVARAKEDERAKLVGKLNDAEHLAADRERKNLELYKLGQEILARYEAFGLGRALAAREPFTGLAKVKLEELVQDYKDKLADNLTRSVPSPSPAPAPAR